MQSSRSYRGAPGKRRTRCGCLCKSSCERHGGSQRRYRSEVGDLGKGGDFIAERSQIKELKGLKSGHSPPGTNATTMFIAIKTVIQLQSFESR